MTSNAGSEQRPAAHTSRSQGSTPSTNVETLVLASWNLSWLAATDLRGPVKRDAADYARLARYARLLDADIIAVQEVESVDALARVFDTERYAFHVTADNTAQKTGFVYAKRLNAEVLPDHTALAIGKLRSGAELALQLGSRSIRLLSVHLKSGCFDRALDHGKECRALALQIPALEAWMDEHALRQTAFAVLGDFNRRFFGRTNDEVWAELDDAQPVESDLDSPTRGQRSSCWGGAHPQFIDHLVLSRTLAAHAMPGTFAELTYAPNDEGYRKRLSDHCAIRVTLAFGKDGSVVTSSAQATPIAVSPPIKGNVARGGKRWFHTVNCPNYARVEIEAEKGERYFENEEEARLAGFERSPDCRN